MRILINKPIYFISVLILLFFIFIFLNPGIIAPYNPLQMNPQSILQSPSFQHIFGTDEFGRDIFSRCVYGIRTSLFVSFTSIAIASIVGTIIGIVSGYYGGLIDMVIMRLVDALFALPSLILALFVISLFGASTINEILAISIIYTPIIARMIRSVTLSIKSNLYVEASKALGTNDVNVIFRHAFPNIFPTWIVIFTLNVSTAILADASLSFLGLGTPPPTPTLGGMISSGTSFLPFAWWISVFPGIIIAIIVIVINVIGDFLDESFNPKKIKQSI
jgi:ABC-type dipeptide/oligopeptide/nickel transport system permease subunit